MPNQMSEFDKLFQALGDGTRRAVIERLSLGPATVTELAAPFEMALPSFMQHLSVLESCGLVTSSKSGRVRTVRLEPHALRPMETWLFTQRVLWERRLEQLDAYVLGLKEEPQTSPDHEDDT
ncbi:MAG: helix-turn-helix transcriptional regulator [Pleurocapsa sp. SU_196_0]|nr:helix-turn-helix transcriptional regulator [Pleurocapsa sp. SU_196_0]